MKRNLDILPRYALPELTRFVVSLFSATGMDAGKAEAIADSLITADSIGHSTHGLALATPLYLEAAKSGVMCITGDIRVVNDRGACITWDGLRLPGSWLIAHAIDAALERIELHGVVTVAIANSHHTGALADYLPRLTERGLWVQLICSSPANASQANGRWMLTVNPATTRTRWSAVAVRCCLSVLLITATKCACPVSMP